MSANPNPPAPIVTLTSDFGICDAYVAAMKAAILRQTRGAVLVDVTHQVAAQDVLAGSFVLERAVDAFAPGTVHLAVVDPGVGGRRRILVVQIAGQYVVCPDNGLITWAWRRLGNGRAFELTWRPRTASRTFHGRDIMAPAAGMLAAGRLVHEIAVPIHNPILLNVRPARSAARMGQIIYIDHFGNATTNIPREAMRAGATFETGGRKLGPLRQTYGQVRRGEALVLVGSAELLEIAVREKSAAQVLSLRVGDRVRILD